MASMNSSLMDDGVLFLRNWQDIPVEWVPLESVDDDTSEHGNHNNHNNNNNLNNNNNNNNNNNYKNGNNKNGKMGTVQFGKIRKLIISGRVMQRDTPHGYGLNPRFRNNNSTLTSRDLRRILIDEDKRLLTSSTVLEEVQIGVPCLNAKDIVISAASVATFLERLQSRSLKRIVIWPFLILNGGGDNSSHGEDELHRIGEFLQRQKEFTEISWTNVLASSNESNDNDVRTSDRTNNIPNNLPNDRLPIISTTAHEQPQQSRYATLDTLLKSLSQLPAIEKVEFAVSFNCTANTHFARLPQDLQRNILPEDFVNCNLLVADYIGSIRPLLLCPSLRSLSLRNVGLTDDFCTCLRDTLLLSKSSSSLSFLDIRYNHLITMAGFTVLYEYVVTLDITYTMCFIEMDDIRYFGNLSNEIDTQNNQLLHTYKTMKQNLDLALRANRAGRNKIVSLTSTSLSSSTLSQMSSTSINPTQSLHESKLPTSTKDLLTSKYELLDVLNNVQQTRIVDTEDNDLDILYYLLRSYPTVLMMLQTL